MSTHKVSFREWEFEVDSELTRQTYARVERGSADDCSCAYCKDYVRRRDDIFPYEILELFAKLGIDYKKDCEVWECDGIKPELRQYSGWFHFAGKVTDDALTKSISFPKLIEIRNDFQIFFRNERHLNFFDKGIPLIQVEFIVDVPLVNLED